MKKSVIVGGVLLVAAAGVYMSGVFASRSAEGTYRHELMENIAGTGKVIAGLLRGEMAGGDEALAHQARVMAALARATKPAFQTDTRMQDTRTHSTDAIWENWADFSSQAEKFNQAASAFLAAAESGDQNLITQKVEALFKSCGACHEKYRSH